MRPMQPMRSTPGRSPGWPPTCAESSAGASASGARPRVTPSFRFTATDGRFPGTGRATMLADIISAVRRSRIGASLGLAGHAEAVAALARRGVSMGAAEFVRRAGDGDSATIRLMLRAGQAPDAMDETGVNALTAAALAERRKTLKLLANFADIEARLPTGDTALLTAARIGTARGVAMLAAAGADLEARDRSGNTALIVAALAGRTEVIRVLVDAGAALDAGNGGGQTALLIAAHQGHAASLRTLLRAGADPDRLNNLGAGALLAAAESGREECVAVLLSAGADPDSGRERTALTAASARGRVGVAKLLLEAGANPVPARGPAPLAAAVGGGHSATVEALIAGGADPNARDAGGRSLLLRSLRDGKRHIARILLSAPGLRLDKDLGALFRSIVDAGDEESAALMALKLAADGGDFGASLDSGLFDAVRRGAVREFRLWLALDGRTAGARGNAALGIAAAAGNASAVAELLALGAASDSRDRSGTTPLMRAAQHGHLTAIDRLLAAGADPGIADNAGSTPLHRAAATGAVACVTRLAEAGAPIEQTDNRGRTALQLASLRRADAAVAALRELGAVDRVSAAAVRRARPPHE
ncbi:MAG: hypothetical protein F4Z71_05195 [Gammaproteobacteria bacterium]|nr:hypothetical protein [Gammaproteobacteria bacterium]MYE28825.1 hypothetical protein [Gammaproteobacteria bacterium]